MAGGNRQRTYLTNDDITGCVSMQKMYLRFRQRGQLTSAHPAYRWADKGVCGSKYVLVSWRIPGYDAASC